MMCIDTSSLNLIYLETFFNKFLLYSFANIFNSDILNMISIPLAAEQSPMENPFNVLKIPDGSLKYEWFMIHLTNRHMYCIEFSLNFANLHAIFTHFKRRSSLQLEYRSLKSPSISKQLPQLPTFEFWVLYMASSIPVTEGDSFENLRWNCSSMKYRR